MNGIEKITSRIREEAEAAAAEILGKAKAEADSIGADYENRAAAAYEADLTSGKEAAYADADRKLRAVKLSARKDILELKQLLISQAYDMAASQIKAMPEPELIVFLAKKAAQASVSGKEELVFNAEDRKRLGSQVVLAANTLLAGDGRTAALKLSAETRAISGGMFVADGKVEVNCTIDALIANIREELDGKVARTLFD